MRAGDWPEPVPALTPRPAADRPWVHEGHRIRLEGREGSLVQVSADRPIMTDIEHAPGEAARLHAEGVSLLRGAARGWLATALDVPLFAWREPEAGSASWRGPDGQWRRADSGTDHMLELESADSEAWVRFEATSGSLHLAHDRVTWRRDGKGVLVAIVGRDAADRARTLDLLERRGLPGLAGQRARHAEHLVRGGAAVMTDATPGLTDTFEWAKVRADARLGSIIHREGALEPGARREASLLAEALLAAGLGDLPRALERLGHSVIQSAGGDAGSEDSAPAEVPRLEPPMADDVAAGIASSESVAGVLTGTIRRDWGVAASGATGRVTIRPDPARLGTRAALSRVRAGGTAIDLRFRRRGDVASLSLRRGAGPAIGVDCAIRGTVPGELLLDGEPLGGEWASFDLAGSHDLQARLAYGPQLSSASS